MLTGKGCWRSKRGKSRRFRSLTGVTGVKGAAEATRGEARGDSTQKLRNAEMGQCRRQKVNKNAKQGKTYAAEVLWGKA